MYVVIVSLQIRPDRVGDFLPAIERQSSLTLREEEGCLQFEVLRDAEDPAHFVLYEVYEDENAYRVVHRSAPYFPEWRAAVEACLEEGGQANTYCLPAFGDRSIPGDA